MSDDDLEVKTFYDFENKVRYYTSYCANNECDVLLFQDWSEEDGRPCPACGHNGGRFTR